MRLLLLAGLGLFACRPKVPTITEPFADDFERAEVGHAWHDTGAGYRVVGGKLNVSLAKNHPLWLRRKLPRDVVIEIDAMSRSADGDLKLELFGDGETFDPDQGRYDPSGYVVIFGGWKNSLSAIGRLGEHDAEIKASRADPKVEPNRTYSLKITRRGGAIDWQIDGKPFLSWTDPAPLSGSGHEYFGVNNWEADVYFDNLRIRPAN